MGRYKGDLGGCREVEEDRLELLGGTQPGEIWGDMGRYRGDIGRCREVKEDRLELLGGTQPGVRVKVTVTLSD